MLGLVDRLRAAVGSEISVFGEAADEIERLNAECRKLAGFLMSEYVWVHEYKIAEVDDALRPYLGREEDDASIEPSSAS